MFSVLLTWLKALSQILKKILSPISGKDLKKSSTQHSPSF